jgi:hypothetical protein
MDLNDLKTNLTLKIITVILAFIQPLIILLTLGQIHSISSVWDTNLQPLFIIANAATSFYFLLMTRWQYSGMFLMLLTAFSMNIFPNIHNAFALAFFVSVVFSFKREYWFIGFYLISVPLFFFVNMLWAEIYAIFVIATYHLILLIKLNKR